jgi:hypothetical protein
MRRVTPLKLAIIESGRLQKDIAAAVAERLGRNFDQAQLSRIVNGLHADEHTRHVIADILRRNVDDLFPSRDRRVA